MTIFYYIACSFKGYHDFFHQIDYYSMSLEMLFYPLKMWHRHTKKPHACSYLEIFSSWTLNDFCVIVWNRRRDKKIEIGLFFTKRTQYFRFIILIRNFSEVLYIIIIFYEIICCTYVRLRTYSNIFYLIKKIDKVCSMWLVPPCGKLHGKKFCNFSFRGKKVCRCICKVVWNMLCTPYVL